LKGNNLSSSLLTLTKENKMKFDKQTLIALACKDHDESYEIIETEMTGQRRWVTEYTQVFKYKDKYYETFFDVGSTENCDTRPYEYEGDEVDCEEVVPVERTIIVYEKIK
jgi:hypothetical protein